MDNSNINEKFIKACDSGNLEEVKKLYLHSLDKQKVKLKFFKQEPLLNAHYDNEQALYRANYQNHVDVIKFLLDDKDFVTNMNKDVLPNILANAISGGVFKINKFEIVKIICPLSKEINIPYNKNLLISFTQACEDGLLDTIEYLAENFDIYSKLPTTVSYKPYSLKEHGFIAACEKGKLELVKFFLTSDKLKEKIDVNQIVTNVMISNKEILNYLVFDFNIARDSFFAQNIIGDNLERILEKRDIYKDLNSNLSTNNSEKSTSKLKI